MRQRLRFILMIICLMLLLCVTYIYRERIRSYIKLGARIILTIEDEYVEFDREEAYDGDRDEQASLDNLLKKENLDSFLEQIDSYRISESSDISFSDDSDTAVYEKEDIPSGKYQNTTKYDMRACWVSFMDIESYLSDMDEATYTAAVDKLYDDMIRHRINTVIFHVRPMCDAIYPSEYFPYSTYISYDRGELGYDALSIAIEEAHKKGLRFDAWINPYRVSKNDKTTESYKQTAQYEAYKDFIIEYENADKETCLILDPARDETVELILDGISELLDNYDVDGIHFDDYFYMDGVADELSIEEKQENVDLLIRSSYELIKSMRPECEFGISPAGNPDNARRDGADIDRWLSEEGYVDYIMPQLYWTDEFIADSGEMVSLYSLRCKTWMDMNKLDKPIYVGLALYKAGEYYESDRGWYDRHDNLTTECETAYEMGYDGYALFRYEWLSGEIDSEACREELSNLDSFIGGKDTDF